MDMLYISDLYKRFSDKKVLNGLNLSVLDKGTMQSEKF